MTNDDMTDRLRIGLVVPRADSQVPAEAALMYPEIEFVAAGVGVSALTPEGYESAWHGIVPAAAKLAEQGVHAVMVMGASLTGTARPSRIMPVTTRFSTSSVGVTTSASSVLLLNTPDSIVSSPTTKKRGAWRRAMSGRRVRLDAVPMPTFVSGVIARAVIAQRVSESPYVTSTVARPSAAVRTSGFQKIVARKS